jgi:hypothetical protein
VFRNRISQSLYEGARAFLLQQELNKVLPRIGLNAGTGLFGPKRKVYGAREEKAEMDTYERTGHSMSHRGNCEHGFGLVRIDNDVSATNACLAQSQEMRFPRRKCHLIFKSSTPAKRDFLPSLRDSGQVSPRSEQDAEACLSGDPVEINVGLCVGETDLGVIEQVVVASPQAEGEPVAENEKDSRFPVHS